MSKYPKLYSDVINYLEENLDETIDVDNLCKRFALSKFHFHRQCSVYFGMPVMSLMRLLRFKRAAYQLAYREDMQIIEVALATGYDSHEAFSRRFRKYFNMSPSEFRKSVEWSPWQKKYEPIFNLRSKIMTGNNPFEVETVDFQATKLAVLEHRGEPSKLSKTVQSFIRWRKENRLPPSKSRTFNLVYDDPNTVAPEDYKFDVCCAVQEDVQANEYGVITKSIPQGKCAFIRHIGSDDTIGISVNYLYSEWLLASTYNLRDFPIFFERVSFFPEVAESEMITDIYLPIE